MRCQHAYNGITLNGYASSNTIGGASTGARNVISGNAENGVAVLAISDTGNSILGNYIGPGASGSGYQLCETRRPVCSFKAVFNYVGTLHPAGGNLISGNGQLGVWLLGTNGGVLGSVIQRNIIGLNAAGTGSLGNFESTRVIWRYRRRRKI